MRRMRCHPARVQYRGNEIMKITIETPKPGEEDEIIVRCANIDEKIMNLIYSLKSDQDTIMGYQEDKITRLLPKEVYYFESVDNRVFAYTAKGVYLIHKKLYEIEEEYTSYDFMRISKASIINISKIAYVRPIFNGRFEAKLKNDEKVIISRQYVMELKKRLGI